MIGGGGRRRENGEGEVHKEETTGDGGDEREETVAFSPEDEVEADTKVV